jgi:hypothetical protein
VTRGDAIVAIIRDARAYKGSLTSYNRIKKVCLVLMLDSVDIQQVLSFLDYHDSLGKPHPWLQKEIEKAQSTVKSALQGIKRSLPDAN